MRSWIKRSPYFMVRSKGNISTTLMYSFAQRKDTKVFDEPLYGNFFQVKRMLRIPPDAELIINSMENNGERSDRPYDERSRASVDIFKKHDAPS